MQDLKDIFQWLGLELPRIQTNNIFPVLIYLESNPNSSCVDIFANARINVGSRNSLIALLNNLSPKYATRIKNGVYYYSLSDDGVKLLQYLKEMGVNL